MKTNKSKRWMLLAAATALILGACSSGSSGDQTATEDTTVATEVVATDESTCATTYQVGWANLDAGILYYRDLGEGLQKFADENCWELIVTDAAYDIPKQISQIEDMIVQGLDLIIAAPGDRDALVAVYEKAKEANIPMLSTGNNLSDGNSALEIGFVGTDWEVEGRKQTEWMVEKLNGTGNVARLGGVGATQYVQKRKAGFETVMANTKSLKVVFNQDANGFNQEEGLRLAQDALTKNPDITVFWCDSDALALGAVQAINERGLDHSKILVLGSDGEPIAFDQIRTGDGIDYTRALHGYQWGLLTAKAANSYLKSGATGYDYLVQAPTEGVSADNIKNRTNEELR